MHHGCRVTIKLLALEKLITFLPEELQKQHGFSLGQMYTMLGQIQLRPFPYPPDVLVQIVRELIPHALHVMVVVIQFMLGGIPSSTYECSKWLTWQAVR